MTDRFVPIDPCLIKDNAFKLIALDWMLVTAGNIKSFNTMTASWGAFGELWHKNICICFVRPVRYTYGFMEEAKTFTLSFFEEKYRHVLKFCGTESGRDVDKIAETKIMPVETESGSVYFAEARLVMECRKIYFHDINPANFLDPSIEKQYPDRDYHRMYIGQVIQCLKKR